MNTSSPPPVKRPPFKTDNFAHQLAKASWVCPIIIAILLVMGRSGSGVIIDLVTLLLMILGLVFGIVALFGIRKHGKGGILVPAVSGILINAFLLFIFASNFLTAYARARQQREAATPPVVSGSKTYERRILRSNNPPADKVQTALDNNSSPALDGPGEIISEMEGGDFYDLVFYVDYHQRFPDGSQIIRCLGSYQGVQVGFEVRLNAIWEKGSFGENIPIVSYAGEVTYHSVGADSDRFLHTLDQLYGTKLNPVGMANDITFKGLSLEGDPRNLDKGIVKIKLFFISENEDEYAEFFTNIDLPKHRLEVCEKDMDYRKPLVKALGKQKANQ